MRISTRRLIALTASLAGALLLAGTVAAAPINDRPNSIIPGPSSEATLQQLLSTLGPIHAIDDQSNVALWDNNSGVANATLLFEIAGNQNVNEFGMYALNGGGDPILAPIFAGHEGGVITRQIKFTTDGVEIDGDETLGDFADGFGFYLKNVKTDWIFYTEDDRNGGAAQALVYQGDNETEIELPTFAPGIFDDDEWIIAWEDLPMSEADNDYQDLIVHLSNIHALEDVPEPTAALLLGIGILGVAGARRARG
jgi:hypothetical protein